MTSLTRGVLAFLLAMVAHWWWTTHLSAFGVAPQLLLVLTVIAAARGGPVKAMVAGFSWGLFLDLLNARLFGANALALTLVGYGTGSIRRQVDVTGIGPQTVVIFSMTWAYFLLIGMLSKIFASQFLWVGWAQFLIDPFYNCFVGLLIALVWQPTWERSYAR